MSDSPVRSATQRWWTKLSERTAARAEAGSAVRPPGGASKPFAGTWPGIDRLTGPSLLAIVAALYLALAQVSIWLNDPVQLGGAFWPAAGLSLGLLLVFPRSAWPAILGGVAVAEVSGDLAHGYAPG